MMMSAARTRRRNLTLRFLNKDSRLPPQQSCGERLQARTALKPNIVDMYIYKQIY